VTRAEGFEELYTYYLFGAFGMLLGETTAARNTRARQVSILIMLVGNLLFALVFSEVMIALSNLTRTRDRYAERMRMINERMGQEQLPRRLQRRVRRFYEFMWMHMRGMTADKHGYLADLPNGLRVDVSIELFSEFLKQAGCE